MPQKNNEKTNSGATLNSNYEIGTFRSKLKRSDRGPIKIHIDHKNATKHSVSRLNKHESTAKSPLNRFKKLSE